MNTRANPVYRAIVGVLDHHSIAHEMRRGSRHNSVHFMHGGRAHRVIVPQSPSDHRGPANARCFIRRLLRITAP
jgi:hypothetical protein